MWGNESSYLKKAVDEGWISSRGEYIVKFEQLFARTIDVPYAVAVSNGTNALHLALSTLGIGKGDEVIVPDFSMISPILAVLYCGATPIPIDADATWNLDPELVEEKISSKTRAIVIVHTYGHPAQVTELIRIARKHSLFIIEDAAEALGATVNGKLVGGFGDIACFSFYANKTITTGEGGMLITKNREWYEKARWKRDLCFGDDSESRFIHREIGFNYRLTNLQAAVGVAQMEHFAEAVEAKIAIGETYNSLLKGIGGLTLPPQTTWAKNVYWVYGIVVGDEFGVSRSELQRLLRDANIETRNFFFPIHRQPIMGGNTNGSFKRSVNLAANGLYLPSFIGISTDNIRRVCDSIYKAHDSNGTNSVFVM